MALPHHDEPAAAQAQWRDDGSLAAAALGERPYNPTPYPYPNPNPNPNPTPSPNPNPSGRRAAGGREPTARRRARREPLRTGTRPRGHAGARGRALLAQYRPHAAHQPLTHAAAAAGGRMPRTLTLPLTVTLTLILTRPSP